MLSAEAVLGGGRKSLNASLVQVLASDEFKYLWDTKVFFIFVLPVHRSSWELPASIEDQKGTLYDRHTIPSIPLDTARGGDLVGGKVANMVVSAGNLDVYVLYRRPSIE